MSIYSNKTEQDLISLRKPAEQQKNQRALKVKNRVLRQTKDIKLAESLSSITKKIDVIKESIKQLGKVIKRSSYEKENYHKIVHFKLCQIIQRMIIFNPI